MATGGTFHLEPGQLGAGPFPPGSLLDVLAVAAVVLDADGRIGLWSRQAEQLFGYTAREALGQYASCLLVHEQHADLVIHPFAQVMGSGKTWSGVFLIRHKDGTTRLVEFRNMRLENDRGDLYALGLATDVAALRTVERDLALSTRLVSQSPIGLAVLDTDLRYVAVNPALEKLNGIPAEGHLGRLPREVVPMLGAEEIEASMRQVLETGVPILDQDRVGRTPGDPDRDHAWSSSYYRLEDPSGRVLGIAVSLVDTTERHQATLEAEHARRHLALVADASVRIGTTLDLYQTAHELADLTVPRLADIATVDILDSVLEGSPAIPETHAPAVFRALALTSTERSEAVQAADEPGRIAAYGPDHLVTRAVRTGQPVLLPDVSMGDLHRIAPDQEAAALLARAGVHSYLAVPLTARGEVIGALDLKRTRNPEPFDHDDAVLAGELATRAAISIDNARWYQSVRNTALTLQHSLLPEHPPTLVGLEIASRYQPAGAACEVGGDWFDIIPLSHDRTALVVGDVMGNGIDAATTMGRLRTATQAFTELDLAPDQMLHYLDKITSGLEHYIATCIYAVYDPHHGQCRIANAGHLPPALVHADRSTELIDLPVGAPLGVGGVPFRSTTLPLGPDDRLVFYTDGLVEVRSQDIDARLTALLAHLAAATDDSLETMCDLLLNNLRDPASHDDVALLIAQVQPDARAGDCPTGRRGPPVASSEP
ncbi:SpoIIE family protein phosphatase [Streptomyces brasiliensis]|uniref:protein-serine/threonine phosphatase n=1 Tax=Streptomyces brasiliensis TaxID=1954 RepID=A0A917UMD1_9ACTN|nr:SpoIIE family protein phosphatase [Streptomyces brasiliensis]GGJ67733.1 hypothetical protein GCM10010121_093050 [Streptomyces brasiliensis]